MMKVTISPLLILLLAISGITAQFVQMTSVGWSDNGTPNTPFTCTGTAPSRTCYLTCPANRDLVVTREPQTGTITTIFVSCYNRPNPTNLAHSITFELPWQYRDPPAAGYVDNLRMCNTKVCQVQCRGAAGLQFLPRPGTGTVPPNEMTRIKCSA